MERPRNRSKIRLKLGQIFYSARKQLDWFLNDKSFARNYLEKQFDYVVYTHKTPIFRKLSGVSDDLQANKLNNLKIAIKELDGLCIFPEEKFSFWKMVGKPTSKRGFLDGLVLKNGKLEKGIGGGMCQLTNMLYWLAIHSDLAVVERWRHGYDVFPDSNRKQPFGSGATCGYPNIDLQLENQTSNVYQLCLRIEDNYLIGEIRSRVAPSFDYEVIEKDHKFVHEEDGGITRHNKVLRKKIDSLTRKIVAEELISENHAFVMYRI